MRLMPLSFPDVRAARTALAAGAVAGLVVVAACTDSPSSAITSPKTKNAPQFNIQGFAGFGHAKFLNVCVAADPGLDPATIVHFQNTQLNRNKALDGFGVGLTGNGFYIPVGGIPGVDPSLNGKWVDGKDGGTGTTMRVGPGGVAVAALLNTDYTVAVGGCSSVLWRTVPDDSFRMGLDMTLDSNGLCDPAHPTNSSGQPAIACGDTGNDSFAAANIQFMSASNGWIYDHTDCLVDEGEVFPQHINPAPGNVATIPWPMSGYNPGNPAFANYGCDTGANPVRGFVNYEHGGTVIFHLKAPPVLSACTSGPDAGGAAAVTYYGADTPRIRTAFNESEVLTGFALDDAGVLHGWYTDEHAMTLGIDSIYINNKAPAIDQYFGIFNNPTDYAIEKMSAMPTSSTTAKALGSPFIKAGRVGTTSPPVGILPANDPAGRPLRPGLYLTDLTVNGVDSKIGDWQMGNDSPVSPTAIFGTWKAAILTLDNTKNPPVTSMVNRADPAKNHKIVGPGGTNPPAAAIDNGYSTDNQWTLATLETQGLLIPGHAYRAQFIVHDGDQNKTGGDVGQACINIQY